MTATYFILNLLVMGLVIFAFRLKFPQPWRLMIGALAVLLLLTLVFDNLMIALDLFEYNPERISGIRVGIAPIEDFMYPMVAFLLMPALWHQFRKDNNVDDN